MLSFIVWYLFVSLIGLVSFPIAWRLLPALGDRGYAFSRSLGLLVWGYIFWLLATLGILQNDGTGLSFALVLLLILSAWSLRTVRIKEFISWLRSHLKYITGIEILFLLAFATWTFIRAMTPEATGTEKPMELAFINAISRSKTFPPNDPWLSGYSISYYYFGYVLTAMLAGATGVSGSVAFNLGIALTFALCVIGSYALVNNLLAAKCANLNKEPQKFSFLGLLGPLFLLIVSNLEGFLHALHNRGLFWSADESGKLRSSFWTWLDIKDLNLPPGEELSWIPTRFWWWWRASRVIQDYDLAGNAKEIIDEFPFFSYLLADLHPHVLVMPFALLAMAIALNLLLGGGHGNTHWTRIKLDLRVILWLAIIGILIGFGLFISGFHSLSMLKAFAGIGCVLVGIFTLMLYRQEIQTHKLKAWISPGAHPVEIGKSLKLDPLALVSVPFILGSIAFLNTWDMLLFLLLIPGAYALGRVTSDRIRLLDGLKEFIWLAIFSAAGAIFLYIPFIVGFSSQAGGIIPNLIYPTRGAHLWVMFAPLLFPIFSVLLYLLGTAREKTSRRKNIKRGVLITLLVILLLGVSNLLMGIAATFIPQVNELFLGILAANDLASLLTAAFSRRLISSGGVITLGSLLALTLALLLGYEKKQSSFNENKTQSTDLYDTYQDSNAYVMLLIFLGALFVLGPEFFYLRDQFGWRMNTIFKFYYQTWLVWSIAAAYGSALLLKRLAKPWSYIFTSAFMIVIAMSLVYPALSLWNKTDGFNTSRLTLDSAAYLKDSSPDELAAINWLKTAPMGVIAEAVSPTGGSYTNYGRVSTHSGLPAVLGWMGHESQWRGGNAEMGSRQSDIERLYCSRSWEETRQILDDYNIRYVILGSLERTTYKPNQGSCAAGLEESKFLKYLVPVYQQGNITIYQYASN